MNLCVPTTKQKDLLHFAFVKNPSNIINNNLQTQLLATENSSFFTCQLPPIAPFITHIEQQQQQ